MSVHAYVVCALQPCCQIGVVDAASYSVCVCPAQLRYYDWGVDLGTAAVVA
jgi:hypothetical protein